MNNDIINLNFSNKSVIDILNVTKNDDPNHLIMVIDLNLKAVKLITFRDIFTHILVIHCKI